MLRSRLLWELVALFVVGLILYFLGVKLTKADLHVSAAAEPLACLGGTKVGELCVGDLPIIGSFPITNALIMTVVVDLTLVLTIVFAARNMKLIPQGFQNSVEALVEAFYNFALGVDRKNVAKFFPLCATIFLFFLYANMFALVPGVGSIGTCEPSVEEAHATGEPPAPSPVFSGLPGYCEAGHAVTPFLRAPAADLNVTFAFALAAVFMVEVFGFQALGLNYLSKFFNFREGFIGAFVGILELISEFVRIIAFAFRIFGNIFGGEVIILVMAFLFPYILPLPFYGFEVFVAFIQALIFAVLTLVFMSMATIAHGGHDEHGHAEQPMPLEAADVPGHGGAH
jgi:F-type H+-transporting ATPase subunit a